MQHGDPAWLTTVGRSTVVAVALVLVAGCNRNETTEVDLVDPAIVTSLPAVEPSSSDWPWWRGVSRDGHASGPAPPPTWSADSNILWQTSIPGRGHASPSIWGDQLFVATADSGDETMSLLALNRHSGDVLWTCEVHAGGFMHSHSKNSHASATPACDDRHVYTAFMVQDGLWVSAIDHQGDLVWQTKAGDFRSMHGYGSSPVIYESLVIVNGDNPGSSFIAALHRESGDTIWRVRRENEASFGTPVIAHIDGRDQLLLSGHNQVTSYDPGSGKVLWESSGPAATTANTVAWHDDLVFASGGFPEQSIMAIRADGSGDVVWEKSFKVYVPSMLVVGDTLLAVQDNGVTRLFACESGDELWRQRLGGNFSASPILHDDLVFVPDESGTTHVFRVDPEFEPVAQNRLESTGFASPVICDGRIYLRTGAKVYCIGDTTDVSTESG